MALLLQKEIMFLFEYL